MLDVEIAVDLCSYCGRELDPQKLLEVTALCGHCYHYECLTKQALTGCMLSCSICGARGPDFLNPSELVLLHQDSTPIFKRWSSELELRICTELTLGRPVTLLTALPTMMCSMEGLRTIELCGHPISALPPAIGKLKSLKRLVFISLYLQELPDEICDLPELGMLNVCGCNLKAVPPGMSNLSKLWSFSFDCNRLACIPDVMPPLIDGVRVTGNRLEHLPEFLGDCPSVANVLAHANRLTSIPESLCRLKSLRNLTLHGNCLRRLPDAIGELQSVSTLLLADNYLESLPESVGDMFNLEWLFVYNNQLTRLPNRLLQRTPVMERLLVEANPLSEEAINDLLAEVPDHLRVLGVDMQQVKSWGGGKDLARSVTVGRMLPWGRLYAKLMSGSQLSRRDWRSSVDVAPSADTLVVAFSASQGEPEWLGVLAAVARHEGSARARIARDPKGSLRELLANMHTTPSTCDSYNATAMLSALWHDYCAASSNSDAQAPMDDDSSLRSFDVLSLCDTNLRWYYDTEEYQLDLETKLQALRREYKRILFLGVSMGGFGALLHAHLADTVAVFGPQVDLCRAHLRPAMLPSELEAASRQLQVNVQRALMQGTRVVYHVAMEDHLVYARWLPLPPGSLIVHPFSGRIARVLERAGVLLPLLMDLVDELQNREVLRTELEQFPHSRFASEMSTPEAWSWQDDTKSSILVSKWVNTVVDGSSVAGMCFLWATPHEIFAMCQDAPEAGDWMCNVCKSRNQDKHIFCQHCKTGLQPSTKIAKEPWREWKKSVVYNCMNCRKKHWSGNPSCRDCGGSLGRVCQYCDGICLEVEGRTEPCEQKWYCNTCWQRFGQQSEAMKELLPKCWYVEGGQNWSWHEGDVKGFIEFDRYGRLQSSWGQGKWWLNGADMDVSFGPKTWKLVRVPAGFTAWRDGYCTRVHGRPVHGTPSHMEDVGPLEGA